MIGLLDAATATVDPAVRDRFEAAIAALARQRKVWDTAPRGPRAWAAVVYDQAGVGDAAGLLEAAGLPPPRPHDEGGPASFPHW